MVTQTRQHKVSVAFSAVITPQMSGENAGYPSKDSHSPAKDRGHPGWDLISPNPSFLFYENEMPVTGGYQEG